MEVSAMSFTSAFSKYAEFIKRNPLFANELELALRWVSYLAAGRFTQSVVVSELIHSSSNLLTLLNDAILRKAANIPVHVDIAIDRLQTSLAVIEYVEVFAEVTARSLGGNRIRWLVVVVIQLVKCAIRLVLVLKHKQGLQQSPPIPPLNRRRDIPQFCPSNNSVDGCNDDPSTSGVGVTFTLKRSGRVIRTLETAPPLSSRTWKLPNLPETVQSVQSASMAVIPLTNTEVAAEIIHIMRPLVHLAALGYFGNDSWRSWLTAFAMDVSSLRMLRNRKKMQHAEKVEWSRRILSLLVYLLRSPFYDHFSKTRILSLLQALNDKIPGAGILIRPLIEYIPEWQRTYFYTWYL